MSACRSCGAPIRWVRMTQSGKANPLDPHPSPIGNVRILDDGETARVVPAGDERESARRLRVPLYLSHFATCASAHKHRRSAA